jgi:hypothetical protein
MGLTTPAILGIWLLTLRLWCPHYGGPEVQQMPTSAAKKYTIKCGFCHKKFSYNRVRVIPRSPFNVEAGAFVACTKCGYRNRDPGTTHQTNFKFSCVSKLLRDDYKTPPKCRQLESVHNAFVGNMDQVLAFGRMPQLLRYHYCTFWEHFDFKDGAMLVRPLHEEALERDSHLAINPKHADRQLAHVPSLGVKIGLNGLLSSMVTGTWTAFETLAGDLWEEALNVRPDLLADFCGAPDRIQKLTQKRQGRTLQNGPKFGKSIDFARSPAGKALADGHGTHHRENLVTFGSLPKIRAAYSCAFKRRYARIDNALSHSSIDTLNHVRNVLVHKSGIVDAQYVALASSTPRCPRVRLNKPFPLRGDLVAKLIMPVVRASATLLSAVDAEVLR